MVTREPSSCTLCNLCDTAAAGRTGLSLSRASCLVSVWLQGTGYRCILPRVRLGCGPVASSARFGPEEIGICAADPSRLLRVSVPRRLGPGRLGSWAHSDIVVRKPQPPAAMTRVGCRRCGAYGTRARSSAPRPRTSAPVLLVHLCSVPCSVPRRARATTGPVRRPRQRENKACTTGTDTSTSYYTVGLQYVGTEARFCGWAVSLYIGPCGMP